MRPPSLNEYHATRSNNPIFISLWSASDAKLIELSSAIVVENPFLGKGLNEPQKSNDLLIMILLPNEMCGNEISSSDKSCAIVR